MSNIAKSVLWVTFSEILFNLSGFIIHSVLGRLLGPADYGRYSLVVTLTTMVIILIGNGIPTAMAKYISEFFEKDAGMVKVIKKQALILQSILISTITAIFFLIIPFIAKILNDPTLVPLFRISTLIIPAFAAASFYFSYYTGLHKFNIQALLKTLRSIFRIAFVIVLALFFRVEGSIIGYIIAPLAVFLVALGIDKFKINPEVKKGIKSSSLLLKNQLLWKVFDWKKLINYAWQIIVFFLAYELFISIDLYLVKGILRNDSLTGIYNASLTIGRIPYYIFYAMTVFLLPMVSRSTAQNNHQETKKILTGSLRLMLILLAPMVVLMSVFAKPILLDFYGKNYVQGAYPMSILVFGVGFLTIFYVMSFAMNGAGKTKITMFISIIGVFINSFLNYILIKKYSLTGSAIATSIASFLAMLLMLYYLHRDFRITFKLISLAKILAVSLATYFFAGFFPQGEITFIFWSIIAFGFYLGLLYLLEEIKREDLIFFKNIIARRQTSKISEKFSSSEPEI